MAVSGLVMAGFVVGHLAGNLLVYAGQDALNDYAEFLKNSPQITWPTRIVLLVMFVLHVKTGIKLQSANKSARPVRYAAESTVQASFASRSMLLTGLLLGAYVLLHLAHFTFGWLDAESHAMTQVVGAGETAYERHDAYGMLVAGFGQPIYSIIYLVSMLLLGLHLSHGLSSLFQTLGLRHASYTPKIELGGKLLAWALALGFASIPLAIMAGVVA